MKNLKFLHFLTPKITTKKSVLNPHEIVVGDSTHKKGQARRENIKVQSKDSKQGESSFIRVDAN